MKFGEDLFPLGTFKKQETAGAYIDKALSENLNIIAKKISNDMTFLGIISGHDSVGTGKTTFMTQIASYLTWKINQIHGTNNTFTHKNLVFKGTDLAKRSFELPKYSVVCLDEGDDLTTAHFKATTMKLKRYFRKCRQLNQILLLIIPSFFELPKFYALARSHFLVDVEFKGEFDRGFFSLYGPSSKKKLYIRGKRDWDYGVQKADLKGFFFSSYTFFPNCNEEIELYKKAKYKDMVDDAKKEEEESKAIPEIRKEIRKEIFIRIHNYFPDIKLNEIAKAFGVHPVTCGRWLAEYKKEKENIQHIT